LPALLSRDARERMTLTFSGMRRALVLMICMPLQPLEICECPEGLCCAQGDRSKSGK
jgi:hypothetical protein